MKNKLLKEILLEGDKKYLKSTDSCIPAIYGNHNSYYNAYFNGSMASDRLKKDILSIIFILINILCISFIK